MEDCSVQKFASVTTGNVESEDFLNLRDHVTEENTEFES